MRVKSLSLYLYLVSYSVLSVDFIRILALLGYLYGASDNNNNNK